MAGVYYPACIAQFNVLFDTTLTPPPQRLFGVEPKSATITLNSFKEADTFEMVFDAKDFPFSPELIKTATVSIYLFQETSLERRNQLKELYRTNTHGFPSSNRVIIGVVDEATYEADAVGGGSWFKVVGRDYTALFLDRIWLGERPAEFKTNIQDTIQAMADVATNWLQFDASGKHLIPGPAQKDANGGDRIEVEVISPNMAFDQIEAAGPVTGVASKEPPSFTKQKARVPTSNTNRRHKQTASQNSALKDVNPARAYTKLNKKGPPTHPHDMMSYWDLITDTCIHSGGARVFVYGTKIFIAYPSDLQSVSDNTTPVLMAFGNNIEKYEISRKLGKESLPRFVVYGYDYKKKKQLSAVFPPDSEITDKVIDQNGKIIAGRYQGIAIKQGEIREIPTGLNDLELMFKMAKGMYLELSRTEGITKITTKDLKDLNENQIDLLRIRVGFPIFVLFDDLYHEQFVNLSIEQRTNQLLNQGYSRDVAQLVAENWEYINTYHNRGLYVRNVVYRWDVSSGVGVDITAINYINPDLYDVNEKEKRQLARQ